MRYVRLGISWLVVIMSLATASESSGAASFTDSEFIDEDWELVVFASVGSGSASATRVAVGGSAGAYREITIDVPAAGQNGSDVYTFHARKGATFTPESEGAIRRVDYSECGRSSDGALWLWTGPALRQDGVVYVAAQTPLTDTQWFDSTALLGPEVFVAIDPTMSGLIDPSRHPDVSVDGAPVEFGFVRRSSVPPEGEGHVSVSGIDNWSIEIELEPEVPIRATTWTQLKARFD